ncbi:MAG: hypothetical protein KIT31_11785 [Deltaproteobacteria bacterium]|nr:hypothetical protein [Deltaproteobacteria bacterium]
MRAAIILAFALLTGCAGREPAAQRVSFGPLDVALPADWAVSKQTDNKVTWAPPDNARKESLSLTRTAPREALAKAGPAAIERFLVDAQKSLPGASFGLPTHFTTPSGMMGVRIEGDFLPSDGSQRYRRVHAVLVDGVGDGALLHAVYTAAEPDSQPMRILLDSLQRKGA